MSGTLDDYGADSTPDPPLLKRKVVKQSPHTGKIAGFVCRAVKRNIPAYATRRFSSHYYYEGEGYAISDSILRQLERHRAPRIFVYDGETDNHDVWEFRKRDYTDGKPVPEEHLDDKGDPQTYIPKEDALYKWHGYGGSLFVWTFEEAMERIDWKGYDPELKRRRSGGNTRR